MPIWNGWTFVQTPAEAEAESIADYKASVARYEAKRRAIAEAEEEAIAQERARKALRTPEEVAADNAATAQEREAVEKWREATAARFAAYVARKRGA